MKGVFASKVDPRVDLFLPINRAGEQRSDRRGDIECNQTLASTRGRIDSRDQQAAEAIAQYDPQCVVPGCSRPSRAMKWPAFCDMHRKRLDRHGELGPACAMRDARAREAQALTGDAV